MSTAETLITIAAAAAATIGTRALPFLAFPAGRETPAVVRYLGQVLPGAVFGFLVVYCLRNVDVLDASHGIPEAIGVCVAAGLYLWRRSMLAAICMSTLAYIVLVNVVF